MAGIRTDVVSFLHGHHKRLKIRTNREEKKTLCSRYNVFTVKTLLKAHIKNGHQLSRRCCFHFGALHYGWSTLKRYCVRFIPIKFGKFVPGIINPGGGKRFGQIKTNTYKFLTDDFHRFFILFHFYCPCSLPLVN